MMLFAPHSPNPKTYRFVARIRGRNLAAVDKSLRLRCTLNSADHTVVGLCAVALHLGTSAEWHDVCELVHEPIAPETPAPKYYEVVAVVTSTAEPRARIGSEIRLYGIVDADRSQIVLPEIVLGSGDPA